MYCHFPTRTLFIIAAHLVILVKMNSDGNNSSSEELLEHGGGSSSSFAQSFLRITTTLQPTTIKKNGSAVVSLEEIQPPIRTTPSPQRPNIAAPVPENHFTTVYSPLPSYAQHRFGPMIIPIIIGNITIRPPVYEMFSTVVLVRDGGKNSTCNILVDTGLPIDRNVLLASLATHGVRPSQVNYVLLTHGHPDHSGNQNVFPSARTIFGRLGMRGHTFVEYRGSAGQSRNDKYANLCNNSRVYATAGHTSSDLTLLVSNVQGFGNVSVTGDLFMSERDFGTGEIWRTFSSFPKEQEENRRAILCLSDIIFPGHGRPFRVNDQLRKRIGC